MANSNNNNSSSNSLNDWLNQNVTENVSSDLNNLVANIVMMIWISPYRIMQPIFKYLSNNKFRNILLLTWFILAFTVLIITTILNYLLDSFSSLEWYIAIIMVSIILMILNGIIKAPKLSNQSVEVSTNDNQEELSVSNLADEEEEEELPIDDPNEEELPIEEEEEVIHDLRKSPLDESNISVSIETYSAEDTAKQLKELEDMLNNSDLTDDNDDDDSDESYYD